MTPDLLPDNTPDPVRESIEAANAATQEHKRELVKVQKTRRELTPVLSRLNRLEDTWGAELEAAMIPRGNS